MLENICIKLVSCQFQMHWKNYSSLTVRMRQILQNRGSRNEKTSVLKVNRPCIQSAGWFMTHKYKHVWIGTISKLLGLFNLSLDLQQNLQKTFFFTEVQLMITVAGITNSTFERKTKHEKYRAVSFHKAIRN